MLEHDQFAFKVNQNGTWFFTVSITTPTTTTTDNNKSTPTTGPVDRKIVVGQLAKLPKRSGKIEVLLRIDNFIDFPEKGGKESKIQMSVGGNFETGDLVLLRMAPPERDLFVTFHGIHENDDLPATKV